MATHRVGCRCVRACVRVSVSQRPKTPAALTHLKSAVRLGNDSLRLLSDSLIRVDSRRRMFPASCRRRRGPASGNLKTISGLELLAGFLLHHPSSHPPPLYPPTPTPPPAANTCNYPLCPIVTLLLVQGKRKTKTNRDLRCISVSKVSRERIENETQQKNE